jgi:hypothetical protein
MSTVFERLDIIEKELADLRYTVTDLKLNMAELHAISQRDFLLDIDRRIKALERFTGADRLGINSAPVSLKSSATALLEVVYNDLANINQAISKELYNE